MSGYEQGGVGWGKGGGVYLHGVGRGRKIALFMQQGAEFIRIAQFKALLTLWQRHSAF